MGAEVQEGVGGTTGVLGQLRGTGPGGVGLEAGRVVAIRADMDALPIEGGDLKDVPYRTAVLGARHVCGHDAHVAMARRAGAGAPARPLGRDDQAPLRAGRGVPGHRPPAGRGGAGGGRGAAPAGRGRRAGAADGFPEYPVGTVAVRPGVIMTGMDLLDLEVLGEEARSSTPQKGVDAIVAAAQVVLALQTLASRGSTIRGRPWPSTSAPVQGGQAPRNLLADRVTLRGLVRAADPQLRAELPARVERIAHHAAAALRARCEVRVTPFLPHVVNDPALTERFVTAVGAALGRERVLRLSGPRLVGEFVLRLQRAGARRLRLPGHREPVPAGDELALPPSALRP